MIYITRRPEKTIYGSYTSRWTSIFNSYLFEVTRQDYNVTSTAVRPAIDAVRPTVETDAVPAELPLFVSAGDSIYLSSGIYTGVFTVYSVTNNFITLDTDDIGVGGSGYVNLVDYLLNFKMYFNIYDATGEVIETLYTKPNQSGLVMLDVSGAIQKLIDNSDTMQFVLINEAATEMSGEFYLGYGFSYKIGLLNITTTEQIDNTDYFWTSSAQQITGKFFNYGQNLAEYVPFNTVDSVAKFLTAFVEPVMFIGYPFSLSFIYSEDFETTYLSRHQQNNDVNGTATSAESSQTLFVNGLKKMNYLQLDTTDATTEQLDVWLETGGAIPDGGDYYDDGMIATGYIDQHAAPIPT